MTYPLDRKCETCQAEPNVWCNVNGKKCSILHAARLRTPEENAARLVQNGPNRRGGWGVRRLVKT